MHVIEPTRYKPQMKKTKRWSFVVIPAAVILIAGAINYLRPLPASTVTFHVRVPAAATPTISWPKEGEAAIAAENYGLLGTSGSQSQLSTASTTKVILSLCILQKLPLSVGQSGPTYTVDTTDVGIYNNYLNEGGSLLPVSLGEHITEYQALQALMIPSANNIADSLVRWIFGSQSAYATYASEFLQQHGINNTHIGIDASGYDASTTSTASDMTQVGLLALKNPALLAIAGQSYATFPLAGTVDNYDTVLGQNGITGLKTGNNDIDMGAFIFTATAHTGSSTIPITGAIMGATSLSTALQESVQLAGSLEHGFEQITIEPSGQAVGMMQTEWGASSPVITADNLELTRWKATPVTEKHQIDTNVRSGVIGALTTTAGPNTASVKLRLDHPLAGPSFWWRLTRR